jgi:hypothetical protein
LDAIFDAKAAGNCVAGQHQIVVGTLNKGKAVTSWLGIFFMQASNKALASQRDSQA